MESNPKDMSPRFDSEASRLRGLLPVGPRVVVIGSASFWDPESERTCVEIGAQLAEIAGLVLITGGVGGVGDTVGRSFYRSCGAARRNPLVYHVLPELCSARPYGETLLAGEDMRERREILARLASVYVAVEGGPGTEHEGAVALQHGSRVIPVGRSGGYAGQLYAQVTQPTWADDRCWAALGTANVHPRDVAAAVSSLVQSVLHGA